MRNEFLPKIKIDNKEDPDMTKLPFYCYPFEYMYDGVPLPLRKSSNKWYKMMSKVCKVDIGKAKNTPEKIIKKIKDKMYELYHNRQEQNINLLKQYSQTKIVEKKNKSKSKRKEGSYKKPKTKIKKEIVV